ncbi:hypothetical protein ABH930_003351 [Kitasatospora sp. GAS204A]|nr:hypothetical protein [Kitasatospora sp. GAS204B]
MGASRSPKPPKELYTPRVGEVVRDARTGRTGVYQCPGYGKYPTVFLRPEGGGVEWEVPASEVELVPVAGELEPVRQSGVRSRPQHRTEL